MQYIVFDATADFVGPISNLSELLNTVSSEPLLVTDPVKTVDKLLYIYTSGTTGLPKAAIITHRKWVERGRFSNRASNFKINGIKNYYFTYYELWIPWIIIRNAMQNYCRFSIIQENSNTCKPIIYIHEGMELKTILFFPFNVYRK